MNRLRVGLVGANAGQSWAKFSHVPAIKSLSGLELRAVATRHEDSAKAAADDFGVPLWFADYRELVTSDEIDIVSVSVKVPDHRDVVLAALAAGKHVYCEWPLGRDLAEAEELTEASSKSKVHTAIGLQGRMNPASIKAAQMLQEGAIGKIKSARMISTSMGFGPKTLSTYEYFDDPKSGANVTTIMGGHALDLLLALLGPIKAVQGLANIQFPVVTMIDRNQEFERSVPDQVFMLLRHTNNAAVAVEIRGGQTENFPFSLEVDGSEGILSLTGGSMFGFQGGNLELSHNGKTVETRAVQVQGAAINIAELYSQFAVDIEQNTHTVKDFKHALELTKLIANVSQSAKVG